MMAKGTGRSEAVLGPRSSALSRNIGMGVRIVAAVLATHFLTKEGKNDTFRERIATIV